MITLAAERQVVRLGASVFRDGRISRPQWTPPAPRSKPWWRSTASWICLPCAPWGPPRCATPATSPSFWRGLHHPGSPVEIISGLEEARLVHLGVQSQLAASRPAHLDRRCRRRQREIIFGRAATSPTPFRSPSGRPRLTELFLKSDPPDSRELRACRTTFGSGLPGPRSASGHRNDRMIATSSTAAAVVCAVNRVRRSKRDHADRLRPRLRRSARLYREVTAMSLAERRDICRNRSAPRGNYRGGRRRAARFIENFHPSRACTIRRPACARASSRIWRIARWGWRRRAWTPIAAAWSRRFRGAMGFPRRTRARSRGSPSDFRASRLAARPSSRTRAIVEAAAYLYNIGHFVERIAAPQHSLYLVDEFRISPDFPNGSARSSRTCAAITASRCRSPRIWNFRRSTRRAAARCAASSVCCASRSRSIRARISASRTCTSRRRTGPSNLSSVRPRISTWRSGTPLKSARFFARATASR